MEENRSCPQRFGTCIRIHWNGFFYVISPLVLLPFAFMEPIVENRTWFIMFLALIWYMVDAMPQGIIALLPIVFYPLLGVLSSSDVCMAYARDSQMVFMLSCYIGVAVVSSKVDRYIALVFLKCIGVNPSRILVIFMITSFLLSAFISPACVCSIMIPVVKAILQILDEINVCKPTYDEVLLKDDERPYPSKVANALYIGVAYAANMGSMASLWSFESGYELMQMYERILHNSNAAAYIHFKFILTSGPTIILLLIFTMVYLQVVFLGLMRSEEHRISYNSETSVTALNTILNNETSGRTVYITITLWLLGFYIALLLAMRVYDVLTESEEELYMKYSAIVMFVCVLAFICPNNCDFLNYFICKKPSQYKPSPSILAWSAVGKLMPWNMFLVYGSSLAFGVAFKHSGLYRYHAEWLVEQESAAKRQVGFMYTSVLFTLTGANHLVANPMLLLGAKSGMAMGEDPSLFTIPIVLASSLSFVLPASSVTNSFATGWGNLRSRDLIVAGFPPTIVGFILIFIFINIANAATPFFQPAYDMLASIF